MRLQLATILRSRDGSVAKDSGLINAYAEKENPDVCYKRAGLSLQYNLQSYGADPYVGQGIFQYNGDTYTVIDDVLIKNNSASYST